MVSKEVSARQIIRKEYGNSKNFVTPRILKYGKINKRMAYELSAGEGIDRKEIYGVSIAEIDETGNTKRRTDLSNCFFALNDAISYIDALKRDNKLERKKGDE